jgi:tRNA threonylcarbamoyladenosine biosynthesis protein TsaE
VNLAPHNISLTYTLAEIDAVVSRCLSLLTPGHCYIFTGDLGAGKTTFIRALVAALGCTDPVSSPTYVLQHLYSCYHGDIEQVEHWDLYRTPVLPEELLHEASSGTLRFVEWGEKFDDLNYAGRVSLTIIDESTRQLDFCIL